MPSTFLCWILIGVHLPTDAGVKGLGFKAMIDKARNKLRGLGFF